MIVQYDVVLGVNFMNVSHINVVLGLAPLVYSRARNGYTWFKYAALSTWLIHFRTGASILSEISLLKMYGPWV